jgi:amino acid transporter
MSTTTPVESPPAPVHTVSQRDGLFARQATGLVRDISGRQAIALNFLGGVPPIGVAYGVFFALSGFPSGNVLLGVLLTIPLVLAFSYAFGLLSAVIPRSGGDYMLVSRILNPAAGMVSSTCMLLAVLLATAALAVAFSTQAVAPGLATVGYVAHSSSLISAANTVATSHAWQFVLGGLLLVGGCAVLVAAGSKRMKRVTFTMLGISMSGLFVVCIVNLFTSRAGFVSTFNHFAHPYTHVADSYHATIAAATKAGIGAASGYSWKDTWPLIGVMASFGIYSYTTAFMAGEIRQGGSMKTAHRMAIGGVLGLLTLIVVVALFYKTWGREFLAAGYGNGLPKGLDTTPTYVFLSGAQVGSSIYSALLAVSFALAFPATVVVLFMWGSRILFAWSFDGLLPARVTKVSSRNAPVTATALTAVLMLAVTAWAVFIAKSLIEVVVYTTLIQLVAMALLIGISAIALPYRRRALYRASASAVRLGGVPATVVAGVAAIASGALLYYLYFHFPYFGLTNKAQFFVWLAVTVVVGLAIFYGARAIRRRQGIDLDLVYAEIPPE